jgi:hypothetical protein
MSDYNEIFKGMIVKAMEASGSAIEQAVDVVQTQAPILVGEMLTWYFIYNLLLALLGLLLLFAAWKQLAWVHKKVAVDEWDVFAYFPSSIVFGVLVLIGSILFNVQWLKIWVAPRLWMIEYAASLVK